MIAVVLELEDVSYDEFRKYLSVGEEVLWNLADNEEGPMWNARIAIVLDSRRVSICD